MSSDESVALQAERSDQFQYFFFPGVYCFKGRKHFYYTISDIHLI